MNRQEELVNQIVYIDYKRLNWRLSDKITNEQISWKHKDPDILNGLLLLKWMGYVRMN